MNHRLVLSTDMLNCGNETFSDTKLNTSEDIYCNKQIEDIINAHKNTHTYILARCEETS